MLTRLASLARRPSIAVLGAKLVGLAAQIAVTLLLTRLLTVSDFGRFTTFVAAASLMGAIFTLGFDKEVVRNSNHRNLREFTKQSALLLALCLTVVYPTYRLSLDGNASVGVMLWIAASTAGALKILAGYFRSAASPLQSEISVNLSRSFVLLPILIICWLNQDGSKIEFPEAILFYSIALFLAAMIVLVAWHSRLGLLKQYETRTIKQSLVSTSPFLLITIATSLNAYADILIISYVGESEDVATYSIALRIANLLAFGTAAMNVGLGPDIARAYDDNKLASLGSRLRQQTILGTMFAITLGIVFVFLADDILSLFGSAYSGSATTQVLWILLVSQCVSALFGPVNQLVMFTKGASASAGALLLSATVNIALNLILVPKFGSIGAAYSFLCSTIVWNMFLTVYLWRRLELSIFFRGKRDT